jgi:hypothetical protein
LENLGFLKGYGFSRAKCAENEISGITGCGKIVRRSTKRQCTTSVEPVWMQLEGQFQLYLAQAQSNRAPRGRRPGPRQRI